MGKLLNIYKLAEDHTERDLFPVTEELYLIKFENDRYSIVKPSGEVVRKFETSLSSDCDYEIVTRYEMRDGTLLEYFGKDNHGHADALMHWRAKSVCHAWREISKEDELFQKIQNLF